MDARLLSRPLLKHPAARWLTWSLVCLLVVGQQYGRGEPLNGFELDDLQVPRNLIEHGGPPRDGIPALTDPNTVAAYRAELDDDDRIIGLVREGQSRAYPVRILNYHEIVNDTLGGQPVLITYCPLCGSALVFDPRLDGQRQLFGVSGLLYKSDVLLYDRASESLWSQLAMRAIAGPRSGQELALVVADHTTWADWRARHPDTTVLSFNTGHRRDYHRNPYADYARRPGLYFAVGDQDDRYPAKSWVSGVVLNDSARAYPESELAQIPSRWVEDRVGTTRIQVRFDPDTRRTQVRTMDGKVMPVIPAYWFAWMAFYPESSVFVADDLR